MDLAFEEIDRSNDVPACSEIVDKTFEFFPLKRPRKVKIYPSWDKWSLKVHEKKLVKSS